MFTFTHEQFSGPLDLLLQLIEEQHLKITEVSLTEVTDHYVHYVEASGVVDEMEMADFLLVAARLLYLKSRALLPQIVPAEEAGDLTRQLKMYEQFVRAAAGLQHLLSARHFMYPRDPVTVRVAGFQPPRALTAEKIHAIFQAVRQRLHPQAHLPTAEIIKVKTLHERVTEVQVLLRKIKQSKFHELLLDPQDKADIIVTFLALLELVKQRVVHLEQADHFTSINIKTTAL